MGRTITLPCMVVVGVQFAFVRLGCTYCNKCRSLQRSRPFVLVAKMSTRRTAIAPRAREFTRKCAHISVIIHSSREWIAWPTAITLQPNGARFLPAQKIAFFFKTIYFSSDLSHDFHWFGSHSLYGTPWPTMILLISRRRPQPSTIQYYFCFLRLFDLFVVVVARARTINIATPHEAVRCSFNYRPAVTIYNFLVVPHSRGFFACLFLIVVKSLLFSSVILSSRLFHHCKVVSVNILSWSKIIFITSIT